MHGYVVFYNGKRIEVHAETSYEAQKQAALLLKVPKSKQYMISVVLAERSDGSQATHHTDF